MSSCSAIGAWGVARGSSTWVACTYDASVKDSVTLNATGTGGFAELAAHVAGLSGEVVYGACPFTAGGQTKYFFFTVVGSGVGGMKKARVAMHKSGIYKFFEGVVADVYAADASEFSPDAVLAKLKKDTGAADAALV